MKEFDFQKLDVYKKAKLFHKQMKSFISETKLERYVKDQLGRASFSVILNIAEGSSRFRSRIESIFLLSPEVPCLNVLQFWMK